MSRLHDTWKTAGPIALGLAAALAFGFDAGEARAQAVYRCPNAPPPSYIVPPEGKTEIQITREDFRGVVPLPAPYIPTEPVQCWFDDGNGDRHVFVVNPRITVTDDITPGIEASHPGGGDLVIYVRSVAITSRDYGDPLHFHPLDHGRYAVRTMGSVETIEGYGTFYTTGEESHGVWADHSGEGRVGIDFRDMSLSTSGDDGAFGYGAFGIYASQEGSYVWDEDTRTTRRARGAVIVNVIETERDREGRVRPLVGTRGDVSDAIRAEYTHAAAYGHVVVTVEGYTIATGGIVPKGPQFGTVGGIIGGQLVPSLTGRESRGIYARHQGHGDIRVKATDSRILTWGLAAPGIFADHTGITETITPCLDSPRTPGTCNNRGTPETRTGGGAVDVDVTGGEIRTEGADSHGVYASHQGSAVDGAGGVAIDLSGVGVSTKGDDAHGVLAWVRPPLADADGEPDVKAGEGDVAVSVTGGSISTRTRASSAVWALHEGKGGVSVTFSGAAATAATEGDRAHALVAEHRGTSGDVALTVGGGRISTKGAQAYGAYARNAADGDLAVTMTGGSISTEGDGASGLYGLQEGSGALAVSMTGGSVTATGAEAYGILASRLGGGTGTVAVTVGENARISASGADSFGIVVTQHDSAAASGAAVAGAGAGGGASPADQHDTAAAIRVTVAAGARVHGETAILVHGGTNPVVDVKGALTSDSGVAIRLRRHGGAATVTIDGTVEGDIILDDGDLVLQGGADGDFSGDINLNGGSWVDMRAEGARTMIGTLWNPGSPYTVVPNTGRIVYDLDAYAGGATVTIPENASLAGVEGEDGVVEAIANRKGNLEVELQAGDGEDVTAAAGRIGGEIRTSGPDEVPVFWYKPSGEDRIRIGLHGSGATLPLGARDLGLGVEGSGRYRLDPAYAPRARVYEALPSLLLGLNRVPTYRDRMAAPRGARGSWARVVGEGGRYKARSSTATAGPRAEPGSRGAGIAYDYSRYGVQAGLDLPLSDGGRDSVGVSVHYRSGTADLPRPGGWGLGQADGRIQVSGFGFAMSGARRFEGGAYDGVYVDGQVAATWYNAKLESGARGLLRTGVRAFGYAVAVEVGREMPVEGAGLVTPRARLVHSQVGMTAFTDSVDARVALERGRSLAGRLGVGMELPLSAPDLEGVRLFGALDVEGELVPETRTTVAGEALASRGPGARARLELGLSREAEDGRYAARAAMHGTTGGGTGYGGELSFLLRF